VATFPSDLLTPSPIDPSLDLFLVPCHVTIPTTGTTSGAPTGALFVSVPAPMQIFSHGYSNPALWSCT